MIEHLWPTPFMSETVPIDLVESMTSAVLQEYDMMNAPNDLGTINILNNENPSIVKFKKEVIYPTFNKFLQETMKRNVSDWNGHRMHGWMTGYNNNYSLSYHNHRGSQISAVFYLLCEEQNSGGQISFTDPRQNSNRAYDASFQDWFSEKKLIPKSGDVVVFPSFLYHYVSTYHGSIRLAMPVDLFLFTNH